MRILNRYILLDYIVIFVTALLLITFVMTVGAMIKAIDLMARGISGMLILQFFLQNIPYILSFSMPISSLFAALLLFGRLSTDSEISAMKACGVSLWRLAAPLIVFSVLISALCVYINCQVAPDAKKANRELLRTAGVEEPINLLEEGRFISDFPGLMIYVGRRNGNVVKDVVAYQLDEDNGRVIRNVRAKRGEIEADEEHRILRVRLYEGRMETPDADDPQDVSKTVYTPFDYIQLPPIDFNEILNKGSKTLKRGHMRLEQLIARIRDMEEFYPHLKAADRDRERTRLLVEANQRISIGLGCFTFVLIGIPLGVKSHRKETSIGMLVSLAIVFTYYLFIVLAQALARYPWAHPNLILWVPLVCMQLLGFRLINRAS